MARMTQLLLSGIVWTFVSVTAVRAQVPDELRAAEALAARIDAAEHSLALAEELDATLDLATVEAQVAAVGEFLAQQPNHATALLLSVRLGRVRDLLAFRDATMAAFEDPAAAAADPERPSHAGRLAVLEGVLARDPSVAPAHYWMARLLMEEAAIAEIDPNLERATHHAGEAVALDSDNPMYREFSALLLATDDQFASAAEVLSHPATVGSTLHLLVQDLLALGVPPRGERDVMLDNFAAMTGMMGAANSDDPSLGEYSEVRFRGWGTPDSLTEVEAYYGGRWPGLRFFTVDGGENMRSAALALTPDGDWRAVTDSTELEGDALDDSDTIMLMLLPPEFLSQLAEAAALQGMPDEVRKSGTRVGILFINGRRGS